MAGRTSGIGRWTSGRRRASILLETMTALLVIAIALGVMSGFFQNSISRIREARLRSRAMLLAENKLAELQLGLADMTEGTEGSFDGRPAGFYWMVETEPTEIEELERLTLTVICDDPSEGFSMPVHTLFSPSLNYSYEKLMEISTDTSQLMEIQTPGLQDLLTQMNEAEFPGADRLVKALMAGGGGEMIRLFNQITTGQLSPEQLMELLQPEMADDEDAFMGTLLAGGAAEETPYGPVWSDDDTAVISPEAGFAGGEGETGEPTLAEGEPPPDDPTAARPRSRTLAPGEEGEAAEPSPAPSGRQGMSREDAMREITRLLGRMAREKR